MGPALELEGMFGIDHAREHTTQPRLRSVQKSSEAHFGQKPTVSLEMPRRKSDHCGREVVLEERDRGAP
jgi:hypothetical protein